MSRIFDFKTQEQVTLGCKPGLALRQPPLAVSSGEIPVVGVLISSLAIGGAERIVVDWARRNAQRFAIRIAVLHSHEREWSVPNGVELIRLNRKDLENSILDFGRGLVASWKGAGLERPRVLCHLVRRAQREILAKSGVTPVPVIHNDRKGWLENAAAMDDSGRMIFVSEASVRQIKEDGYEGDTTVIRHLPSASKPIPNAREVLSQALKLPENAKIIAMLGAIKPQKNYARALELLAELRQHEEVILVIFGGLSTKDSKKEWSDIVEQIVKLNLFDHVRFTGHLPGAAGYLAGVDLLLNTSEWEGLSISTLEALNAGIPIVASRVGGQGEVTGPGLHLVELDESNSSWVSVIREALKTPVEMTPERSNLFKFPAHRLWTLEHLQSDYSLPKEPHIVFVTANLNAGGAQRSLVNLAVSIKEKISLEILVTGESTSGYFLQKLTDAGVEVSMTARSRDCFDHVEKLLLKIGISKPSVVCLWNVDSKIKLLLAKVLPKYIALVDVSPGGYAFEEMNATAEFQQRVAFTGSEYYSRLDRLVLKYAVEAEILPTSKTTVIRNGVFGTGNLPRTQSLVPKVKIVVNGRIDPSKFIVEMIDAIEIVWISQPKVELHFLGSVEPRNQEYFEEVLRKCRHEIGARVFFHGSCGDSPEQVRNYDIALVLGHHQGCPNAVLEGMAAGLTVVANDSGGTRELIFHEETGLLLRSVDPAEISEALMKVIEDHPLRIRLGEAALQRAKAVFSMEQMSYAYKNLFMELHNGIANHS